MTDAIRTIPEEDALEMAGTILRGRIAQIFELREAVIAAEDIEAVHDMRVATRRMRSALRDLRKFIAKTDSLLKLSSNLKTLAGILGEARDLDVAIAALREFAEAAPDSTVRTGITAMIDERMLNRSAVQPRIVEAVSEVALVNLLASFNAVFLGPPHESRATFRAAGRRAIRRALDEFLDLSECLYDPSETVRLHELRIAAKRLRYAIEFFGQCWGKRLRTAAKDVAAMQGFLGDLHDADVWLAGLEASEHDQANRWLMLEFQRRRIENHRAAFTLWSNWRDSGLVRRIRRTIDA